MCPAYKGAKRGAKPGRKRINKDREAAAVESLRVSQRMIAKILGWSDTTVATKPIPRQPDGLYFIPDVIRWRVDEEKTLLTRLDAARAEKMETDGELAKLALARERGELVEVALFDAAVEEVLSRLAGPLRGGLPHFASDVQRATTPAEARAVLKRLCAELAKKYVAAADEVEREADAP
jgi:hypothetical protein